MKQKLAFMASLGYARMELEEVCKSLVYEELLGIFEGNF